MELIDRIEVKETAKGIILTILTPEFTTEGIELTYFWVDGYHKTREQMIQEAKDAIIRKYNTLKRYN